MTSDEIISEVKAVLRASWKRTKARVVPDTDKIALTGNAGMEVEGTVLYADMSDSTALVDRYKDEFSAEVYKTYLLSACHVIRSEGGEITAFDGDRVMAVFVGSTKNSDAVKCALKLTFIVQEVNKAIRAQYPTATFTLSHCTGIDTSPLLVAKTGIRQYNDLVWVGPAANYAAKLSALHAPGYPTFITERVYKKLLDASKFGGTPRRDMWEKRTWTPSGQVIYRSNWWWKF
jgi:class 3 adenylate cyclase